MNYEQHKITPLAVTNWRDIRNLFGIKEKNRRGHMYIIGKTGTGKSSLLANMTRFDISHGNGIAVIDPHGDLTDVILDSIPANRITDVIYFDAGDSQHPISFNPLANIHPDNRHLVVSGLISVFKKIWSDFWGPRLEHILRYSLFTLLEYPGSTILDLPPLLTVKQFREKVLLNVKDETVRSFWFNEFDKYSAWLKSEAVAPILNKVSQFLTSPLLRGIIGQPESSFKLRKVMDEGKILIVNLSKGKIGEDASSLLGSMLSTMIYLAALSRVDQPEKERKFFYLYVDEFHNFLTLSFANMLAESRKYGLSLVLAHQYVNQLSSEIRNAIFGNVGTMISFRLGMEDAKCLTKEFQPTFDEFDLINLPNFHIYLKLMIDGATSNPFSATTLPLPIPKVSYRDRIIVYSRKRYNKTKENVKKVIISENRCDIKIDPPKQKGLFS